MSSSIYSKSYYTIQSAAPASPPANEIVIYAKSGGIYAKTSAGVETLVSNVTASSKTYRAFMTQSATAAPTVTVFENGLSADIAWTHSATGVLIGTLTGAFTTNKTFINATLSAGSVGINVVRTSADVVTVTLLDDAGAAADTANLFIEIVVYP